MKDIFEILGPRYMFWLILILSSITITLLYKSEGRIGRYLSFKKPKKENDLPEIVKNHLALSEHKEFKKDGIGYFIPNSTIFIYGNNWNSMLEEHFRLFNNLEKDWNKEDCIDIRNCKLTSSLLNIIDSKIIELPSLTIIHHIDQKSILEKYFNKFNSVILKCI